MKRPPPRLQRILSVPEVDWTKYRFVPESRFARQTGKKDVGNALRVKSNLPFMCSFIGRLDTSLYQ
jgi:hypothetical protein